MSRLVEIVKARLFAGRLFKTDTDNLMPNRFSFPAYQQNGTPAGGSGTPQSIGTGYSGDGQSAGRKVASITPSAPKTPSPFVPQYSGDGQGKRAGFSGDGRGPANAEPQPVWSGGGRHDVHNPMMPTWGNLNAGNSGARNSGRGNPQTGPYQAGNINVSPGSNRYSQRASDSPAMAPSATREESAQSRQVHLSDELVMNVNVDSGDGAFETAKTAKKTSGTWKLIALVIVFLVWVSTASTLLFLYMDRYLFP